MAIFLQAELIAILSAISTCPRQSQVTIYTDSQSIISKYNKLTQLSSPNKLFSYSYWPIWHTLINLIRSFQITIQFYKVIAHSDNEFNNAVDLLARIHSSNTSASYLDFIHCNKYNSSYHLLYQNY